MGGERARDACTSIRTQTLFRRILLFKSVIKCYSLYLFMVLNKNGNKMINFTHNVGRYLNPGVT